ncbi:hypothetical protein Pla100_33950 [Neorhodopirellula pilleata]|uniref:Uncharacterized protein n=1 Tax=Neorhodopirellula pilleata TaxID=2714738 RepID=A0A5C6ABP4_9BACT|nr:hypothetical protein Pla100_33950 [Neorhodopirellula pilleata]
MSSSLKDWILKQARRFESCHERFSIRHRMRTACGSKILAESLDRFAFEAIETGEYLTDHGWVNRSAEVQAADVAKLPDRLIQTQRRADRFSGELTF